MGSRGVAPRNQYTAAIARGRGWSIEEANQLQEYLASRNRSRGAQHPATYPRRYSTQPRASVYREEERYYGTAPDYSYDASGYRMNPPQRHPHPSASVYYEEIPRITTARCGWCRGSGVDERSYYRVVPCRGCGGRGTVRYVRTSPLNSQGGSRYQRNDTYDEARYRTGRY